MEPKVIKKIIIDSLPLLEADVKMLKGNDLVKCQNLINQIEIWKKEHDLDDATKECSVSFSCLSPQQRLTILPKVYLVTKEINAPTMKDLLCHIAEDICGEQTSKSVFDKILMTAICGKKENYDKEDYENQDFLNYCSFLDNVIYYIDYNKVWKEGIK